MFVKKIYSNLELNMSLSLKNNALFLGLCMILVNACDSDAVKLVKNSPVNDSNKGLSIQKAFETYAFCKNGEWEDFTSERGVNYVTFKCDYTGAAPYTFFNLSENMLSNLKKLNPKSDDSYSLVSQFIIGSDKKTFDNTFLGLVNKPEKNKIYQNSSYEVNIAVVDSLLNNKEFSANVYPYSAFEEIDKKISDYYIDNNLKDTHLSIASRLINLPKSNDDDSYNRYDLFDRQSKPKPVPSIEQQIADFYPNSEIPEVKYELSNFKYDKNPKEITCDYIFKVTENNNEIISRKGTLKGELEKLSFLSNKAIELNNEFSSVKIYPKLNKDGYLEAIDNYVSFYRDSEVYKEVIGNFVKKFNKDKKEHILANLKLGKYYYDADKSDYVTRTGARLNEGFSGFIDIKEINDDASKAKLYIQMDRTVKDKDFFTGKMVSRTYSKKGNIECRLIPSWDIDSGTKLDCEYAGKYAYSNLVLKALNDHLSVLDNGRNDLLEDREIRDLFMNLNSGYFEYKTK